MPITIYEDEDEEANMVEAAQGISKAHFVDNYDADGNGDVSDYEKRIGAQLFDILEGDGADGVLTLAEHDRFVQSSRVESFRQTAIRANPTALELPPVAHLAISANHFTAKLPERLQHARKALTAGDSDSVGEALEAVYEGSLRNRAISDLRRLILRRDKAWYLVSALMHTDNHVDTIAAAKTFLDAYPDSPQTKIVKLAWMSARGRLALARLQELRKDLQDHETLTVGGVVGTFALKDAAKVASALSEVADVTEFFADTAEDHARAQKLRQTQQKLEACVDFGACGGIAPHEFTTRP